LVNLGVAGLFREALFEAEKKFRRAKGYRELEVLHRRMNPQRSCASCQQRRSINSSLTQKVRVA
jgi:hypothetical protein